MARPARSAEVVRRPAALDARRRRRAARLFVDENARPLDVLAVRDDAQVGVPARRSLPERLVNLRNRRDATPVDAPHRVALAERRLPKGAVRAQPAHDDAPAQDKLARAPQHARRGRRDHQRGEQHGSPAREQTLREVEREERRGVDELRHAQARLRREEGREGSPREEKPEREVERRAPYACASGRGRANQPREDGRRESHPGAGN